MFKVPAQYLTLIAFAVWLLAGFNVFRLGLIACLDGAAPWWLLLVGIPAVFVVFHMMFSKLVGKHTVRIRSYGSKRTHVLKFFDLKGYILMTIMMGGGIALRAFNLVPLEFIGSFYPGLGTALALTGVTLIAARRGRGPALSPSKASKLDKGGK